MIMMVTNCMSLMIQHLFAKLIELFVESAASFKGVCCLIMIYMRSLPLFIYFLFSNKHHFLCLGKFSTPRLMHINMARNVSLAHICAKCVFK